MDPAGRLTDLASPKLAIKNTQAACEHGVFPLYHYIMQAARQQLSVDAWEGMLRCLTAFICLQETVSLGALAAMMSDGGHSIDVRMSLGCLRSVIAIPSHEKGLIRFIHPSFLTFLQEKNYHLDLVHIIQIKRSLLETSLLSVQ